MEENSKLFVFEKKEVILIFVFIVLIGTISFTLGVRTGKSLSLKQDDYLREDINAIDLKSIDEEFVDTVVKKKVGSPTADTVATEVNDSSFENDNSQAGGQVAMEERLKEEMEKLASESVQVTPEAPVKVDEKPEVVVKDPTAEVATDVYNRNKDFKGKYTIQLYSDQSEESAKDFADGFIVKGYDVIVNEVILAGKGKWYRVSIGIFDDVNQAKDYLNKENKIFQENKYIIQQF